MVALDKASLHASSMHDSSLLQEFADCLYSLTLWPYPPSPSFHRVCEKFYVRHLRQSSGLLLSSTIRALQRLKLQPSPKLLDLLDQQVRPIQGTAPRQEVAVRNGHGLE